MTLAAGSDVSAGSGRMALARLAFVFFCAALVGRILGGDALLNQFYAYTAEGGNLAGKIHPSNYLFMLAAGLLYAGPRFRFRQDDLPLLRAIILFGTVIAAICVLLVAQGRSGAVGYVIDTYLLTLLAMTLMLAFPFAWRAAGAMWIIAALVFNAFLAMGEFAIGRYIIPFEVEPAEFRPAGLLGAALTVGVMNLAALLMLVATRLHLMIRVVGVSILAVAVFISASRTAMILGAALAPLTVLITAHARREGPSTGASFVIMILAAIVLVPIIFMIGSELGFFARFSEGVVDDSARTRVEIYRVFEFVGWREITFDADINGIRKIALEQLGIEHIESPFVTFVFSFGLPMTTLFLATLLYLFFQLARKTHPSVGIGLLAFLLVASTNNTLSTKVPSFCVVALLAVGIRAYHRRVTVDGS